MSLKRAQLKGMNLTDEQIAAILEGHTDTVDALKDRIKELESDLADLPQLKQQLEEARKGSGDDWKAKHDELQQAFDAYKAEIAGKEELAKVKTAFQHLLTEEHIDPRRHAAILRATAFDGMKLTDKGDLEDADALREGIRTDWADFIQQMGEKGADVATPPANGSAQKMTREEIMKIEDTKARQQAIAQNHELFGF